MIRALTLSSVVFFVGLGAESTETVVVTSGDAGFYWDGDLASATVSSIDSTFRSEYRGVGVTNVRGDGSVDFSTSIPFANGGNHPLSQTLHGRIYSDAWVAGSMAITTDPVFLPPATPEGATQSFTTPFTMTGTITAYATSDHSGPPLFTADLTGGGQYTAGPFRVVNGKWERAHFGGDVIHFSAPTQALPAPWQTMDIGAVGTPGDAHQGPDADLFVAGAGSDIWGTADSFRFVYRTVRDAEISTQNGFSQENTNPFAKTGVMIRLSTDPSSPHVILDMKPDGGLEFMTRAAQGGETSFIAGGSAAPGAVLKLVRSGDLVTGLVCDHQQACTTVGSAPFVEGPALIGVAVTSHDPSQLNHAYFAAAMPAVLTVPRPWFSYDVGNVGLTGSAMFQDHTFWVTGAGSDIWGTSDSFQFVRQCVLDDGMLVARVTSEQNADTFGKAGVIMRDAATTVILDVRPNGEIEFMARPSAGGQMAFIAGAGTSIPVWLKLVRIGDQFTGYIAADGVDWRTIGSTTVTMPHGVCVEGGLAVTSHDPAAFNDSTFDHVSATSQAFDDVDVGDVGIAGGASASAGGVVISGAGADIWGTSDAFNFYARGLFGDGQIVARVDAMENTDPFAKAGLMIREGTDPSAAHVILDVNPNGQIEFMTRPHAGDSTAYIAGSTMVFPGWLKLTRTGSLVSGFASADGLDWRLVGSATVAIGSEALTGLVVSSHQRGVLNRAAFSSIGR